MHIGVPVTVLLLKTNLLSHSRQTGLLVVVFIVQEAHPSKGQGWHLMI